jgi:hypothetical protein
MHTDLLRGGAQSSGGADAYPHAPGEAS